MKAQINVTEVASELAALHFKTRFIYEDSLVYKSMFDDVYDTYFDFLLSFRLNSSK